MALRRDNVLYRMTCDNPKCQWTLVAPDGYGRDEALDWFARHFHTMRYSGYHLCVRCVDAIIEADLSGNRCKLPVTRG